MITYSSAEVFLDRCGDDPRAAVADCDLIIKGLRKAMIAAAVNGGISEYDLDDGQTKIKQVYRNPQEVMRSINAFLGLKHYYLNLINGNVVRLVDGKNMTRFNNGCF